MDRNLIEARIKSFLETKGTDGGFVYGKLSNGVVWTSDDVDLSFEGPYCYVVSSGDPGDWTWMSFMATVVGNGPHEVELSELPPAAVWQVVSGGVFHSKIRGSAVYTFNDDRNTIHGVFDLVLDDGITMVGGFYLTKA